MARAASELPGTEIPDADGRRRVVIENVRPRVDNGRFAVKRVAGDVVEVTADVFADGHDTVAAVVRHRREGERRFRETPMRALGNDRRVPPASWPRGASACSGTTPVRAPPRPSTPPSRSSWPRTTRGRTASTPTCR